MPYIRHSIFLARHVQNKRLTPKHCRLVGLDGSASHGSLDRVHHVRNRAVSLGCREQHDLTKTYASDPSRHYYRSRYALYDLQSTLSVSRPVILMNVTNLLNCMRACQPLVEQHLTTQQQRTQCQSHLTSTEEAFESWMRMARPHVISSLDSLCRTEETGRRPHTAPVDSNLAHRVYYISLSLSRLHSHME